ncbi:MAG TPA: hypothetical protein VGE50_03015 [Gammaproteobacteria bacterium]
MKRTLVLFIIFLSFASPLTEAAKPKKQPLRWSERDGEIVLEGVCDDFAYGSLDYRECRAAAKRQFEERCREYRAAADKSGGAQRTENQRKRDMYCVAASQFGSVN